MDVSSYDGFHVFRAHEGDSCSDVSDSPPSTQVVLMVYKHPEDKKNATKIEEALDAAIPHWQQIYSYAANKIQNAAMAQDSSMTTTSLHKTSGGNSVTVDLTEPSDNCSSK